MGRVPPPPPTGDPKRDWQRFCQWHRQQLHMLTFGWACVVLSLPVIVWLVSLIPSHA